jgi:radical SAM superfamily enzyme YgiQ (UPF0313 family)
MEMFRKRSAENVVREFQEIQRKYKSAMIMDDNFLADKKRAHKILDGLIESKSELDLYIYGARVDSAEKGLYKKMKKAGVKLIAYGIESGCQDVLNFYNKKITLPQIRYAVNLAKEMNFFIMGYFILGAPIETKKHLQKTIDFCCSLPFDAAFFHRLEINYGSDLWFDGVNQGKIDPENNYPILANLENKLNNLSENDLNKYCQKAFKQFYFRPNYLFKELYRAITNKDFNIIKLGLKTFL